MSKFLKDILANKTRIIGVISLIILILKPYGIDVTKYIGVDWNTTLTNVFALITLIAIGDNGGVNHETVQATTQSENNTTIEQVPTEQSMVSQNKLAEIQQILNK